MAKIGGSAKTDASSLIKTGGSESVAKIDRSGGFNSRNGWKLIAQKWM